MSDVYYWLASAAIPAILFLASSVVYGARRIRHKYYLSSAEQTVIGVDDVNNTKQQQEGNNHGAKPLEDKNYIKNYIDNKQHSNMAAGVCVTRRNAKNTKRDMLLEKMNLPELYKNNNSLVISNNYAGYKYNNNIKNNKQLQAQTVGLDFTENDIYQIKETLRKTTTKTKNGPLDGSSTDNSPNYDDISPTLGQSFKERYASLGITPARKKAPGRSMKKVTFDEKTCKRPVTMSRALGYNCLTRDACACVLTFYFYTGSRSG